MYVYIDKCVQRINKFFFYSMNFLLQFEKDNVALITCIESCISFFSNIYEVHAPLRSVHAEVFIFYSYLTIEYLYM